VSATASVTVTGAPVTLTGKMIRVRNTARYDVYLPNNELYGSIIFREDMRDTVFYRKGEDECYWFSLLKYDNYNFYGKDDKGHDYYAYRSYYNSTHYEEYAAIYMNGEDVVKEVFRLPDSDFEVIIDYTEVNYDYVHEQIDDAFSLGEDVCYGRYSSNATMTKTSSVCVSVTIPDNVCSLKAEGKATLRNGYGYGDDIEANVTMYRVKDYVRYEFYNDTVLMFTVINRPDEWENYIYVNDEDPENTVCTYFYGGSERLYYYSFAEITEDGLDLFSYYSDVYLAFNHDNHDLVKEGFSVSFHTSSGFDVYLILSINYTSLDYKYVHDDDDDLFVMKDDKCPEDSKGKPKYASTTLLCSPVKTFKPTFPGCAFEVEMSFEDYGSYSEEFKYVAKVMMKDDDLYYMKVTVFNSSMLMRCDFSTNGMCYFVAHEVEDDEDHCDQTYMTREEFFPFFTVTYRGEPEDVKCPDNSTGCKQYCNFNGYGIECAVIDKKGYLVGIYDEIFSLLTYKDTVVTLDDFKGVDCSGEPIEAPTEDPCSNPSSSHTSRSSSRTSSSRTHGSGSSVSSASFSLPSIFVVIAFLLILF